MNTKIIITNVSRLKEKYTGRFEQIRKAVDRLIAADKKRGIQSELIALDDAVTMQKMNGEPVMEDHLDPRQNKKAIEKVFRESIRNYAYFIVRGLRLRFAHCSSKYRMTRDQRRVHARFPYRESLCQELESIQGS